MINYMLFLLLILEKIGYEVRCGVSAARKKHYDEAQRIQEARRLMKQDEDDDEDEDDKPSGSH